MVEPITKNTNISNLEKSNKPDYVLAKNIAKNLALFLHNAENRVMLKMAIENSTKVENILEASEFLNKKLIIKSKTISLRNEIASYLPVNEQASFNRQIKNLKFGKFDIYFPLKEWRTNWKSKDRLLIAAVGHRKKNDRSDIIAYNLRGNEVMLSSTETPTIPILVVRLSEKAGNYKKANISIIPTKPWEPPPPPPPSKKNYYQFRLREFRVTKDYESWIDGDMEIYFKIAHRTIGSNNWSNWQEIQVDYGYEAGNWDYWNDGLFLYESTNPNQEIKVEIWEDDGWGSGNDDFVADANWDFMTPSWGYTGGEITALEWGNSVYSEYFLEDYAGSDDIDNVVISNDVSYRY